ncbi:hypothetical protein HPG69_016505 [Diceros bicornis minor]|uniref:Uncharacterized protein n=1 Tax=Diceros bicornis minor TaxID=77932 RepID=A0A7J7F4S5_DICBM|nr:hypothetical protein HPG69_016505 [Diceros bicornis minor]
MGGTMRGPCERSGENKEQEEVAVAAAGRPAGVPEAEEGSDADSDSDMKTGAHWLGELVKDALHLRSCWAHRVVPAPCFLRQGHTPELSLWHRGLGPQNRLCGAGAEALAGALSKSNSIYDVELSENQLGAVAAQAVCVALTLNPAMQRVELAGNGLEEQASKYLAELLLAHTGLKSLDLLTDLKLNVTHLPQTSQTLNCWGHGAVW